MGDYKDQKELKMAMNGRMGLMTGGILLLFTALSSNLMYGINLMSVASGAAKGNTEYLDLISAANMAVSTLRIIAVCYILIAFVEIYAGIFCMFRCNRLDRIRGTRIVVIALLAIEVVMQIFLTATRMLNISALFMSLVIPLYLLWAVTRMTKIAKLYPDRKFALNTRKAKEQQRSATAKPASKKSLHERAMMNAQLSEDEAPTSEREGTASEDAGTAEAADVESSSANNSDIG